MAPNGHLERRAFLARVPGIVAGSALVLGQTHDGRADPPGRAALLPTIQMGGHRVTRLIAGCNPILGYSYMGPVMDLHMREYFTPERIGEFLTACEREGLNTHQFSNPEKMAPVFRRLREQGSKMQFICLHAGGPDQMPAKQVVEDTRSIAIVHHGGVTDRLFQEGKSGQVHDFVKQVHDAGVMAGVSAHNPDCIKRVADEGWEVDLFMACFYHITRTPEELKAMPPVVTAQIGRPFFAADPARMTAVLRQVKTPCLGFKILAAGRSCDSEGAVRRAFQFAFANLKPTDGVIVGMYPQYHDQIRQNSDLTREYGA